MDTHSILISQVTAWDHKRKKKNTKFQIDNFDFFSSSSFFLFFLWWRMSHTRTDQIRISTDNHLYTHGFFFLIRKRKKQRPNPISSSFFFSLRKSKRKKIKGQLKRKKCVYNEIIIKEKKLNAFYVQFKKAKKIECDAYQKREKPPLCSIGKEWTRWKYIATRHDSVNDNSKFIEILTKII